MKKSIALALVILLVALTLSSCSFSNVESVKIDDTYYYRTIYLYSFKNAMVDNFYSYTDSAKVPTQTGYVYSYEKLSSGDSIKVWNRYYFTDSIDNYGYYDSRGTYATVDRLVYTYRVEVSETNDTFMITHYNSIPYNDTASSKNELPELTKEKIEVVKERVVITYQ